MDIQPLISIVMPAYNCEKYIVQAIESVKRQTYKNWELIIIEDVSTDHSWSVIKKFANEKIFIHRNKVNCGVAETRNYGVAMAKGDWIAFLDSDDLWLPNKLEKQVAQINIEKMAQLLFTGSGFITESNTKLDYTLHVPQKVTEEQLLKQNLISCSSVLIKTELIRKYPMPTIEMIHEDFAVWLQILKEIPYAFGIDEPLLTYRVSRNSKSGNKIKAIKMNWNTYRYIQMNKIKSCYYMIWYILNGIRKYKNIRNCMK